MRFGNRPESLMSLAPTTVSVDEVSALAGPGITSRAAALRRTSSARARHRRRASGWLRTSADRSRRSGAGKPALITPCGYHEAVGTGDCLVWGGQLTADGQ